jgi:hypothetical protein
MASKSIIALLVALFGVVAWSLLKETYIAIAIEEATQRAAEWLGIPRADMIAAATPLILTFGAGAIVAVTSYRLGARDRSLRPAFEFLYAENSALFVRNVEQRTDYFFGLHILSPATVDAPNVWVLPSPFAERMYVHNNEPIHPSGVEIWNGGALDPDVTHQINFCSFPPRRFLNLRGPNDPLGTVQRFTLEARGRHCKPVRAI